MKNIYWLLSLILQSAVITFGQNPQATGLPGDNFSLEGALELFKSADSPEDFEKRLNTEENYVNNLDLNDDGEIDYVKVIEDGDSEAHVLVLQALVAAEEGQDIAVIEIEKTADDEAILQIIGDEDIYGEEILIEPFESVDEGKGPFAGENVAILTVNVWLWPSVRFIYRPGYTHWISPWRWHHYPNWWRPWRPHPFGKYLSLRPHYHQHFHQVQVHRLGKAHRFYAPRRITSRSVQHRYRASLTDYRAQKGIVQTKKTKVVSRPNGKAVIQNTRTTARGRGPAGAGKVEKSKTKVYGRKANGDKVVGSRTKKESSAQLKNGSKVKSTKKSGKVRSTKKTKRG